VPEWTILAHIVRPRGVRGEVIAEAGNWSPDQLIAFDRLEIRPPGHRVRIESAWRQKDRMVLKIEGIDTVEAAETLRGAALCIPKEDRPPAPDGEVYFSDLIGCRVVEEESGEELGTVVDYHEYGGPVLLEVQRGGKELLIPFVPAICRQIDISAKRIAVVLPEGLKDL
jgi:16S rRNA processing protein RimM